MRQFVVTNLIVVSLVVAFGAVLMRDMRRGKLSRKKAGIVPALLSIR